MSSNVVAVVVFFLSMGLVMAMAGWIVLAQHARVTSYPRVVFVVDVVSVAKDRKAVSLRLRGGASNQTFQTIVVNGRIDGQISRGSTMVMGFEPGDFSRAYLYPFSPRAGALVIASRVVTGLVPALLVIGAGFVVWMRARVFGVSSSLDGRTAARALA